MQVRLLEWFSTTTVSLGFILFQSSLGISQVNGILFMMEEPDKTSVCQAASFYIYTIIAVKKLNRGSSSTTWIGNIIYMHHLRRPFAISEFPVAFEIWFACVSFPLLE